MDDIKIATFGKGAAPVLALHCGLGRGTMWKAVAGHLPAATFTAPDLPGHGKSPPFPAGIDVHDAATDAIAPLYDGPMHLVGHSFGATVALRLALMAPERALSLTLIEPVFFAAAAGSDEHARHRIAEEAFFETFRSQTPMAAAEQFNRLWGGGMPWGSFDPPVQQAMADGMGFVVATEPCLWQDCHKMLAPGGLESLDCPVTLLRGARTVPVITDVHQGLMGRIPQARDVVIEGAAHMVVLTHPAEVAAAIAPMLSEAGGPQAGA